MWAPAASRASRSPTRYNTAKPRLFRAIIITTHQLYLRTNVAAQYFFTRQEIPEDFCASSMVWSLATQVTTRCLELLSPTTRAGWRTTGVGLLPTHTFWKVLQAHTGFLLNALWSLKFGRLYFRPENDHKNTIITADIVWALQVLQAGETNHPFYWIFPQIYNLHY